MNLRKTPWMADCEIQIMDSLFETQQPRRVLEWGAGGSTVYWPPRLGFIERWLAVEHRQEYYEALRGEVVDKVDLVYLDTPDYYTSIEEFDYQFDFILIDGHWRVECLQYAPDLLAPRSIVVLHDAGRLAYCEAWDFYPHYEMLYAGEEPDPDGGYKHRGIAVFWQDNYVKQSGWCRDYV